MTGSKPLHLMIKKKVKGVLRCHTETSLHKEDI